MSKEVMKQSAADNWTPEQMKLITDVIAKGATKDELELFLYRCKHLGLDPLKPGQIYFVKYGNSAGTIVIGIEGFRARAGKTGKLSGIKRGALRDDKGKLIGAWAEVYRSDWKEPAREEVPLAEYTTGKAGWLKMPETMIKKVAEAAALRMAFPDDLGGVYEVSEMDQAKPVIGERLVVPEQPEEQDGTPLADAPFRFQKLYPKRGLQEAEKLFGLEKMRERILSVEGRIAKADQEGKPVPDREIWEAEVEEAAKYIGDRENGLVDFPAYEETKVR